MRVNGFLGGICRSLSTLRTALMSRLSSGLPGTTAGPESPPAAQPARLSSRKPPRCFSGPWQPTHRAINNGRTFASKKSLADSAEAAGKSKSNDRRVAIAPALLAPKDFLNRLEVAAPGDGAGLSALHPRARRPARREPGRVRERRFCSPHNK